MKILFFAAILFLTCTNSFAQNPDTLKGNATLIHADTIQILTNGKGTTFMNKGVVLHGKEFDAIFSRNANAWSEYHYTKTYNLAASLLVIGGAGFLTLGAVSYFRYEDASDHWVYGTPHPTFNSFPLIIGLGAVAASIPLLIGSKIHLRKAVRFYNHSVTSKASTDVSLYLRGETNRIGLRMIF